MAGLSPANTEVLEIWLFWNFYHKLYTIYLFLKTQIAETKNTSSSLLPDLRGFGKPSFFAFFGLVFFIVFTEQTFNSWLPSFYKRHLGVNSFYALQASSFLAVFCYLGRIITSHIIKKFELSKYFYFCVSIVLLILLVIMMIQLLGDEKSKLLLFIFPIIGFFLAPLYPVANSKMIVFAEKEKINVLTSIIVIFSSLGSSLSSAIISVLFQQNLLNYYAAYIFVAVIVSFILGFSFFKLLQQKL